MVEILIVSLMVALAALHVARRYWRVLRLGMQGESASNAGQCGSGCARCGGCALARAPERSARD